MQKFVKAEQLMPAFLMEMRIDLAANPLRREFVVLKKGWSYNSGGEDFTAYFYEEHPQLDGMLQILQNLGLIGDVTRTNVKRFRFMEELVDYLGATTIARGATEPEQLRLQARYQEAEPYRRASQPGSRLIEHHIGVFNPPEGVTAPYVKVHLVQMEPMPRNDGGRPPFIPYALPMQSGGDETIGIALPPGQEELWIAGFTATGSDGSLTAGRFAIPNQRWEGTPWRFDHDERWRLSYRIVSEGRRDVAFSVVITANQDHLELRLEA
jgi:hypothetical protein